MTHARTVVTSSSSDSQQLPGWASQYAAIVEGLLGDEILGQVPERLKVKRKSGYAGVDAWLFLLLYFTAKLDEGFKGLSKASKGWSKQLGALAGRERLITQQSLSRVMRQVEPEHVDADFMEWLLVDAASVSTLLQTPATWSYDSTGSRWRFFDFDGKVLTLRKRGLPECIDLPAPERQVDESFAAAGYPGRKRGEHQLCRETLQDGGSGLWLGAWGTPGDGGGAAGKAIPDAATIVANVMRRLGAPTERGVIRFDGFYGSWSVITACQDAGVGYLVRWHKYGILSTRSVVERIEQGTWERVRDSGSGPTRFALDLGHIDVPDTEYRARVVASRFVDKTNRGVGVLIDGYRYELFFTSLTAKEWPAAEVVTQYYGRIGQENRFSQENNELRLNRLFSTRLPGQMLGTLVGFFVWNLQAAAGLRLPDNELPDLPAPSPRTIEEQPGLDLDEVQHPLVDRLEAGIDWPSALPPNFTWESGHGLQCPAGFQLKHKQNRNGSLVFRAPQGVCFNCPLRTGCTTSTQPRYRREIYVRADPQLLADLIALKQRGFRTTAPRPGPRSTVTDDRDGWTPPEDVESGPLAPAGPFLVPSELRRDFRRACTLVDVRVAVSSSPRPPVPRLVAPTPARRQRRRHTWSEKLAWNALPESAKVEVEFFGTANRADQLLVAVRQGDAPRISKAAA